MLLSKHILTLSVVLDTLFWVQLNRFRKKKISNIGLIKSREDKWNGQ